jgi:hypothetical protein
MSIAKWLLLVCLGLNAGKVCCASIKDIVDDPRSYVDKTVTIDGEVKGRLSLFVVKYFTVTDGTASINVITERPLPRFGQKIRVTGKVTEAISLGRETLLVLIEDKPEPSGRGKEPAPPRPAEPAERLPGAI